MNSMFLRLQDWCRKGKYCHQTDMNVSVCEWTFHSKWYKYWSISLEDRCLSGRSLLIISRNTIVGNTWFSSPPQYLRVGDWRSFNSSSSWKRISWWFFSLEAHCKGYCVAIGILIFWGKDCQCEYLQAGEFIFCFDLMSLESIWPHSHDDYSRVHFW